jgi:hypothetical protein
MLDEYSFSGDTPCYTYGLDAAKKNDKFKW